VDEVKKIQDLIDDFDERFPDMPSQTKESAISGLKEIKVSLVKGKESA
jgi:hypothetical protein